MDYLSPLAPSPEALSVADSTTKALDRRGFLALLGLGSAALIVPTKTFSFLGSVIYTPPEIELFGSHGQRIPDSKRILEYYKGYQLRAFYATQDGTFHVVESRLTGTFPSYVMGRVHKHPGFLKTSHDTLEMYVVPKGQEHTIPWNGLS